MRRDRALIGIFLQKYNSSYDRNYQITEVPEEVERNRPAVDAIAQDEKDGNTLAIEHTLIQPFLGERDDYQPFSKILEPLCQDQSLVLPGYFITLACPVGAFPKGLDRKKVAAKIDEEFRNRRNALPDGVSILTIPDLSIDLTVEKIPMGDYDPGSVIVGRSRVPETFEAVLRKAIEEKIPKLLATPANKRVLLLENQSILHTPIQFEKTLNFIKVDYPDLENVDQIWVADGTSATDFFQIWPTGAKGKLTRGQANGVGGVNCS